MKCAECNLSYPDFPGDIPHCHADPNWPAPCEYEEECYFGDCYDDCFYEMIQSPSCSTCTHQGDFSLDDVACCNCCENYSFYEPREED